MHRRRLCRLLRWSMLALLLAFIFVCLGLEDVEHGFARAVFSGRNSRTGHRDMPAGLPHPRPQRWPRMETHPAKRSRNHPLGICLVLLGMGVELFPGVVLCPCRSEAGCIRGSEVPFLPALVHRQPERQLLRRGIHRHAGRAARHPDALRDSACRIWAGRTGILSLPERPMVQHALFPCWRLGICRPVLCRNATERRIVAFPISIYLCPRTGSPAGHQQRSGSQLLGLSHLYAVRPSGSAVQRLHGVAVLRHHQCPRRDGT